ncbi:hypothetical protein AOLI_G00164610 [Acnodon oligacanthus]
MLLSPEMKEDHAGPAFKIEPAVRKTNTEVVPAPAAACSSPGNEGVMRRRFGLGSVELGVFGRRRFAPLCTGCTRTALRALTLVRFRPAD